MEKASPLKSITQSTSSTLLNHVSQNMSSQIQESNLVALKAISLTPPTMNKQNKSHSNNINGNCVALQRPNQVMNLSQQSGIAQTNGNSVRQVKMTTESNSKPCNNIDNSVSHSFKSSSSLDDSFVADFGSASIYSSTTSNSTANKIGTNYQNTNIANHKDHNDKINNNSTIDSGNGSIENFADFENNQIYNAAGMYCLLNSSYSIKIEFALSVKNLNLDSIKNVAKLFHYFRVSNFRQSKCKSIDQFQFYRKYFLFFWLKKCHYISVIFRPFLDRKILERWMTKRKHNFPFSHTHGSCCFLTFAFIHKISIFFRI